MKAQPDHFINFQNTYISLQTGRKEVIMMLCLHTKLDPYNKLYTSWSLNSSFTVVHTLQVNIKSRVCNISTSHNNGDKGSTKFIRLSSQKHYSTGGLCFRRLQCWGKRAGRRPPASLWHDTFRRGVVATTQDVGVSPNNYHISAHHHLPGDQFPADDYNVLSPQTKFLIINWLQSAMASSAQVLELNRSRSPYNRVMNSRSSFSLYHVGRGIQETRNMPTVKISFSPERSSVNKWISSPAFSSKTLWKFIRLQVKELTKSSTIFLTRERASRSLIFHSQIKS